tara:strand:+ start:6012 stop:6599 length:588 start_codon:yes stop_codon:yes gene_type:complete
MVAWKKNMTSGLVVIVPLALTIYVVRWAYGLVSQLKLVQIGGLFQENRIIADLFQVSLTILLIAGVIFVVGYLMRTTIGELFESRIDDIINFVPGLRIVYNATKMAVETTVSEEGTLQSPVKVTVWPGMKMTAFKTGNRTEDGKDILFMPTSPNITTGFVIEVDPKDYEDANESVEDSLARVLSAGFGVKKSEKK